MQKDRNAAARRRRRRRGRHSKFWLKLLTPIHNTILYGDQTKYQLVFSAALSAGLSAGFSARLSAGFSADFSAGFMSHAFLVEVDCISCENSAHFLGEFGGYLHFLVKKVEKMMMEFSLF